jgi:hypothetical protein
MNTRDPSHIPKDLIPITLQTGVSKGGAKEWEFMLDIYQDKDPQFVVMKPAVTSVSISLSAIPFLTCLCGF